MLRSVLKETRRSLKESFVRLPALTPRASRAAGVAYAHSPRLPQVRAVASARKCGDYFLTRDGMKFRL